MYSLVWLESGRFVYFFSIFTEQETNELVQKLHKKTLAINVSQGV